MTTFIAKFAANSVNGSALRTIELKFMSTFVAEFSPFTIVKLAFWAFHFYALLYAFKQFGVKEI
jgi:hypothetical protein